MNAIRSLRSKAGLTQSELAEAGGTSQPTIAAYEAGRKSPRLDTVQRLAESVGFAATMQYGPPLTREERRSVALHTAIARKLEADPVRVLRLARRNLARMARGGDGPSQLLKEWGVMLDRPLDALLPALTDLDPWARELRHVTPFAGVLAAEERAQVYRSFAEEEQRDR